MKLAFYAFYKSFDFFRIGGTDSFIRRLALGLIKLNRGIKIKFVLYGDKNDTSRVNENLELIYIKNLKLNRLFFSYKLYQDA